MEHFALSTDAEIKYLSIYSFFTGHKPSKNSERSLIVHTLKPSITHFGHDLITSDALLQTALSFIA